MAVFWLRKVSSILRNKPYERIADCSLLCKLNFEQFRECFCYFRNVRYLFAAFSELCFQIISSNRRTYSENSRTVVLIVRVLFRVYFRTTSRMFITFVMFDIYSPRFSELSSLTYKWEVLISVQVAKNLRTVIFMVRVLFVYLFAQFFANVCKCLQLFATLDI